MTEKLRVDKILSSTGRWSRKEVKDMVRAGRVTAGGVPISSAAEKFDMTADTIEVDGAEISWRKNTYLMMNKPPNVLSATSDRRSQTVLDLLPEDLRRIGLFPAGRLDRDSVGLLLLTDDGELAHNLLSPRKHVEKKYYVRVDGRLEEADVEAFRKGMLLPDGLQCLPANLEILSCEAGNEAIVTLREGKYHQIKRMMASRGKTVLFLQRLAIGSLTLDKNLAPGQWRLLSAAEIDALRELK